MQVTQSNARAGVRLDFDGCALQWSKSGVRGESPEGDIPAAAAMGLIGKAALRLGLNKTRAVLDTAGSLQEAAALLDAKFVASELNLRAMMAELQAAKNAG